MQLVEVGNGTTYSLSLAREDEALSCFAHAKLSVSLEGELSLVSSSRATLMTFKRENQVRRELADNNLRKMCYMSTGASESEAENGADRGLA